MSRHRGDYDGPVRDNDVATGIREDFWFPDRNGKHRAVEAFNPMTGITTRINDEQEQAA